MILAPPRRGSAVLLAVTCLCLPVLATSAPARAQTTAPAASAGELREHHPLGQKPRAGGTAVRAAPKRVEATTPSPAASSRRVPLWRLFALWLALALFGVASIAIVTRIGRRRRSAGWTLDGLAGFLNPASRLAVAPAGLALAPRRAVHHRTPIRLSQARANAPQPGRRNARRSGRGALTPPDRRRDWIAEVAWGHDEGAGRFQVVAADTEGTTVTIAQSGSLEWPPSTSDSVEAMRRAADELEASMVAAGWEPLPPGDAWYAKRFAWRQMAAPRPAPAPAPLPPTPALPAVRPPAPAPAPRAITLAADDAPPEAGQRLRFVRVPWPKGSDELWRCEVRWRAGYLHSRFEAVALEPGRRRGHPIGRSATFKWLLMGDPTPQESEGAVEELTDLLMSAGWERIADGADWYSRRFVWRGDSPPPRLEVGRGSARDAGK